jgi:hypothetical protein
VVVGNIRVFGDVSAFVPGLPFEQSLFGDVVAFGKELELLLLFPLHHHHSLYMRS